MVHSLDPGGLGRIDYDQFVNGMTKLLCDDDDANNSNSNNIIKSRRVIYLVYLFLFFLIQCNYIRIARRDKIKKKENKTCRLAEIIAFLALAQQHIYIYLVQKKKKKIKATYYIIEIHIYLKCLHYFLDMHLHI